MIAEFRGLLTLPNIRIVPPNYSPACKNIAFIPNGFLSRPGTALKFNLGGGTDIYHMELLLATNRYHIVLMDGPQLYFSKDGAARSSLLDLSILAPTTRHFRFAPYGSLVFVTFSDTRLGTLVPYVWSSVGTSNYFDTATIAAPAVGSFAAANNATPGSVTPGVHKLVVIDETRSGYQTSPSAEISVNSVGAFQLALTNVPVGTANIVTKRHIGMTESGLDTFYLALTIADNVATTGTIDIADDQLNQQTDLSDWFQFKHPLLNYMGVIPYHDRMVYWGDGSILWISEAGLPQTIRDDVGFIPVAQADGDRITNCFVIRDVLYVVKTRSIYAINDNGEDIALWPKPSLACPWAGTPSPSGVAVTSDKMEVFILDVKGLYRFIGGSPELMSIEIAPLWDTVNYAYVSFAECHNDPLEQRVFCWVPTGVATLPNELWVYDYKDGFKNGKWCPWTTAGTPWSSFAIDSAEVDIAEHGSNISRFDDHSNSGTPADPSPNDRGAVAIESYYQPGVLSGKDGGLQLFGGIDLVGYGAGLLGLTIYDDDGVLIQTPTGFNLSTSPGKDFFRRLNLRRERFFLRVGTNAVGSKYSVQKIITYLKSSGSRAY